MANEVTIVVKAKDQASTTISKFDAGVRKMAVGAGVAAGAVGVALVGALKDCVAEATEAHKVTAQTNAVLKSTGGAAKVSAAGVEKLATAISNKTGIDDEAIQSGENLLLTFTNIRNEAGKGNDIFTQSTKIMTDMSVALGQDMTTSAMQLGKALNDPVKGMTALRRVGVTFSKEQEKAIKTMVKHGDVVGAQKVILAELRKEFGGSAEAAATWGDKAKVAADNIKEAFGKKMLPALEKVSQWFVNEGADSISEFTDSFDAEKLDDAADSIIIIAQGVGKLSNALGKFDKSNGRAFGKFGVNLAAIGDAFIIWKAKALSAMATVAEGMGKLGLLPKRIVKNFQRMRDEANKELEQLARDAARKKIETKLRADKRNAQARIREINRELKKTNDAKVISKLKADKANAQAAIRSVNAQLRQLDGKEANVWIRTHRVTYYGTKGKPPTNPRGDAHGGNISTAATGGRKGGMVLVGEQGPEIVDLPFGSHVNSNPDSQRMMATSGRGGGGDTHFHFHGPVYGDHNALQRALVDMKRRGQLDVALR